MDTENIATKYKEQGNKEFKNGNYTQAIEHYTKAIAQQKEKTFYTNRATCFFHLEKYNKCVSDCNEAIALDPTFGKAYYRKADALMTMGKIQEAVETMNRAIELKADDENMRKKLNEAKIQLSYYSDYQVAWEKRDYDTCIRKIDCLLEKCSKSRDLILKKMEILAYQGKGTEALELVNKHKLEFADDSEFKWLTGLIYVYKGNT